jgi:hypothetical protein
MARRWRLFGRTTALPRVRATLRTGGAIGVQTVSFSAFLGITASQSSRARRGRFSQSYCYTLISRAIGCDASSAFTRRGSLVRVQ